jgi:uncharacterized protein YegP (UPF0339 family)
MSSQFQLFRDGKREWRWRLLAENSKIIAASSESYLAKADAVNGIEIVRAMRGKTDVYADAKGEWRWRLVHANGRIIATGAEGYVARSDCEYGLSLVAKLAHDAPVRETAA